MLTPLYFNGAKKNYMQCPKFNCESYLAYITTIIERITPIAVIELLTLLTSEILLEHSKIEFELETTKIKKIQLFSY